MRRDLINEDTNQFGPGTDLIICLLALLIIFVIIVSHLYNNQKNSIITDRFKTDELEILIKKLTTENESYKKRLEDLKIKGSFEHGGEFQIAGTFKQNPYYELQNPQATEAVVLDIVKKYNGLKEQYPYIFIVGHANEAGIVGKPNLSYEERLKYNWEFAGTRSAIIANLMQKQMSEEERNKIIIVSTGEFDLKKPEDPQSAENAFVEVFFGNEWRLQTYKKNPVTP